MKNKGDSEAFRKEETTANRENFTSESQSLNHIGIYFFYLISSHLSPSHAHAHIILFIYLFIFYLLSSFSCVILLRIVKNNSNEKI